MLYEVNRKIKVLIIDDSALIRSLLKAIINSQPDMEAVGAASNPLQAREMIKALNPDVLTLDVNMPEMDGLTFLEKLMRLRPMPVLMISMLTEAGSGEALRAMALGATDFICKPSVGVTDGMVAYTELIADKIRAAVSTGLQTRSATSVLSGCNSEKLIIVGSSTGGTDALKEFLIPMPFDAPAILIVQHLPEAFTGSFAERLNSLSQMTVVEATHDAQVLPGFVYLAPGHSHMLVKRTDSGYALELQKSAPVNHHRPSVDVLFRSAAQAAGACAIGVMLTGMGRDGAAAMLEMRQRGAYNFAQNESTCVVYGMPRAAVENGAVHEIVPISEMAQRVLARTAKGTGQKSTINKPDPIETVS